VLPVRFWQARQWQSETLAGSPVQATETLPQEQVAVLTVAAAPCTRLYRVGVGVSVL
jgi:hypothetical protein